MLARSLIVALLAVLVTGVAVQRFEDSNGMDFYHYWGIAKAREWSGGELGGCLYRRPDRYADLLNEHALKAEDARLGRANECRHELDATGTPLVYMACAVLPDDYSTALGLWQVASYLAFLAAALAHIRLFGASRFWTSVLALALVWIHMPLVADLHVGNVNSFQLLALVLLTAAAGSARRSTLGAAAFLGALGLIVLVKPNLALIAGALALHLGVGLERGRTIRAAVAAAGIVVGVAVLPCLYFDSWEVWSEYVRFVIGEREARLFHPTSMGNHSVVKLASELGGWSTGLASAAVGGGLAASLASAVAAGRKRGRDLRDCIGDPYLCCGLAVTATLAMLPLVWVIYFVLLLAPAWWLLFAPQRWRGARVMGGLGILMTSSVVSFVLTKSGLHHLAGIPITFGWIPVWIGLLAAIAAPRPRTAG